MATEQLSSRIAKLQAGVTKMGEITHQVRAGTYEGKSPRYRIDPKAPLEEIISATAAQERLAESFESRIPTIETKISILQEQAQSTRKEELRTQIVSLAGKIPEIRLKLIKTMFQDEFGEPFEVHSQVESTPVVEAVIVTPIETPPLQEVSKSTTPEKKPEQPAPSPTELKTKTIRPEKTTISYKGTELLVTPNVANAIRLLSKNPEFTSSEIADKLGITPRAAINALSWAQDYMKGVDKNVSDQTGKVPEAPEAPKLVVEEPHHEASQEEKEESEETKKLPVWLRGKTESKSETKFWETPLFEYQVRALTLLINDAPREDILSSMGTMRNNQPFHRGTASRSLMTSIGKLRLRIEHDNATEEEKNIWQKMQEMTPEVTKNTDVTKFVMEKLKEKLGFIQPTQTEEKLPEKQRDESPQIPIASQASPVVEELDDSVVELAEDFGQSKQPEPLAIEQEKRVRRKQTIEDRFQGIGKDITTEVKRILEARIDYFYPVQLRSIFSFSVNDSRRYRDKGLVVPTLGRDGSHPQFSRVEAATALIIKKVGVDKVTPKLALEISSIVKKEIESQMTKRNAQTEKNSSAK